jgi:hypothetical protein
VIVLFEQLEQEVWRLQRIDVEHQAMAVFAGRRQHEDLRLDLVLEFHHQANDSRLEAAGTQQLDVGVVSSDLVGQPFEHAVELDPFEVDNQPLRVLDHEVRIFERRRMLDRHPRVIGRRPDADGENAEVAIGGRATDRADQQQQRRAGELDQLAASGQRLASALRPRRPAALCAESSSRRPASGVGPAKRKTSARSAGGT